MRVCEHVLGHMASKFFPQAFVVVLSYAECLRTALQGPPRTPMHHILQSLICFIGFRDRERRCSISKNFSDAFIFVFLNCILCFTFSLVIYTLSRLAHPNKADLFPPLYIFYTDPDLCKA